MARSSRNEANLEAAQIPPFDKGKSTRVPPEEQSLRGMPGYIKTGQSTKGRDLARGHSGIGPHREGDVGQRGHGSTIEKVYHGKHPGTMTHDYKAASTGKAGHYKMSAEGQPASEPHGDGGGKSPMAHARIGDTHLRKVEGHPGRMEKLSGKAKTHAEGRRKSQMY